MQNAECKMQNSLKNILHYAFCILHLIYLFSMATATSKATFIMVVKEF